MAAFSLATPAKADEVSDLRAEVKLLMQKVDKLEKAQTSTSNKVRIIRETVKTKAAVRQIVAAAPPAAPSTKAAPYIPSNFAYTGQESALTVGNGQFSFTPYGILSIGVVSTSNSNGRTVESISSGTQQLSRIGGRLYWNISDKMSAIAVFEAGLSVANGTLSQSSVTTTERLFGRQIYVGISHEDIGTFTFGRQYDSVVKTLYWSEAASNFASFGTHVGDNDNIFNDFRYNNDVKYQSPVFHNLSASADYAFSNVADQGDNSAYSAGILYDGREKGQGLRIGAAFDELIHPASPTNPNNGAVDATGYGFSSPFIYSPVQKSFVANQRIAGVGSTYTLGAFTLGGNYTNVKYTYYDMSHLNLNNGEIFGTYYITPELLAGAGFTYTWGVYDENNSAPNYKQWEVGLDYFFNPSVDVYAVDLIQRAGGSAQYADIFSLGVSTTKSQNGLIGGTRLKF